MNWDVEKLNSKSFKSLERIEHAKLRGFSPKVIFDVGAYVGANRTTTITGCYCIFSGFMGDYAGVIAGSYLGSNGTVSISDFYAITVIQNFFDPNLPVDSDKSYCWISNHKTDLKPTITLTRNSVFAFSEQTKQQLVKTRYYSGFNDISSDTTLSGTFIVTDTFPNFKPQLLDLLS